MATSNRGAVTKVGRGDRSATHIDDHVASRLRERRVALGLAQHELADRIGVTYQQLHKYERGVNRVTAGRLYRIAEELKVSVGWFFEGLGGSEQEARRPDPLLADQRPPGQRRVLETMKAFAAIRDPALQEAVAELTRALTQETRRGTPDDDGFGGRRMVVAAE